ncbi:meiotic recombination protein REC8 homolog isoform X2 [Denticeps clupeoides]|uniref:meiotic recombination protein REC8 homolog isoform X2 n=1 Tax=Denticeps clupeoides TaxID=299321 RepID=UPI0010A2FD28|nr:meiotic recombination protein REC8 homolog isoform X2 [Denticeps clupeoides]XP_028831965.1 meiotic recombination protein REC8 homolog isoform X2 [Denticeps clupeoides]
MFYYPAVLHYRHGCFATIWLAATKGKVMKRRDYLKVNVQRTCDDIMNYVLVRAPPPQAGLPRPRLSLYLSTQLQYGVVLVYHRQCEILLGPPTPSPVAFLFRMRPRGPETPSLGRWISETACRAPLPSWRCLGHLRSFQNPHLQTNLLQVRSPSRCRRFSRSPSLRQSLKGRSSWNSTCQTCCWSSRNIFLRRRGPGRGGESQETGTGTKYRRLLMSMMKTLKSLKGLRGMTRPQALPLQNQNQRGGRELILLALSWSRRFWRSWKLAGRRGGDCSLTKRHRFPQKTCPIEFVTWRGRPGTLFPSTTQNLQRRSCWRDPVSVSGTSHARALLRSEVITAHVFATDLREPLRSLWRQGAATSPRPPGVGEPDAQLEVERWREQEKEGAEELDAEVLRELVESTLPQDISTPSAITLEASDRDISPLLLTPEILGPVLPKPIVNLEDIPEERADILEPEDPQRALLDPLQDQEAVTFHPLLPPLADRKTVACYFWELLEHVNARTLCVRQDEPYGDITITQGPLYRHTM